MADRSVRSYLGPGCVLDGEVTGSGSLECHGTVTGRIDLDGEVVLCAAGDHLEIWNREWFEASMEAEPFTDEDFQALAERGI